MNAQQTPNETIRYFYQSLREFQFHFCWNLFSNKSQEEFLKWTLDDIYTRHQQAARAVKMGLPEVKLMFEGNDPSLVQTFWRRFVQKSEASDFTQYAYFTTLEINGGQASVQAKFVYPTGQISTANLVALFQRGAWKYAYLESGLPWQ